MLPPQLPTENTNDDEPNKITGYSLVVCYANGGAPTADLLVRYSDLLVFGAQNYAELARDFPRKKYPMQGL